MIKFEKNFIFGLAASSYQIEGAATEDGRIHQYGIPSVKPPVRCIKGILVMLPVTIIIGIKKMLRY